MKVEIKTKILEKYAQFSPKQKSVADYIMQHTGDISIMTMRELANACSVAEPTIVRFLNGLGYDSFLEFRVDLAREDNLQNVSTLGDGYKQISAEDSTEEIMKKTAEAISICLKKTEDNLDKSRIDMVSKLMYESKGMVLFGAGNSSSIAMDASYRLMRIGMNAFCSENLHISLTMISRLSENDVVLLISHSGESIDMLACAKAAREQGAIVVGITGNINSPLAKTADYVLFTSSPESTVYSDAMVSRLAQMMILDILYVKIRLALGDDAKRSVMGARNVIVNVKKS